jgi:hypothetical protein
MLRAEWFDAVSSTIAFSRLMVYERADEVMEFQHLFVRLMSLLHGSALHQINDQHNEEYEVLGCHDFEDRWLEFLMSAKESGFNRVEVVMHWIQELITINCHSGVLQECPPPLLTRVYQELSRGIVHLQNARKIIETPFPFPHAQLLCSLLILHLVITPLVLSAIIENVAWSAAIACFTTTAAWSLNFTAGQLEMPFGDDPNDLPLSELQEEMNFSLMLLLEPLTQQPPTLKEEAIELIKEADASGSVDRSGSNASTFTVGRIESKTMTHITQRKTQKQRTAMQMGAIRGTQAAKQNGSRSPGGGSKVRCSLASFQPMQTPRTTAHFKELRQSLGTLQRAEAIQEDGSSGRASFLTNQLKPNSGSQLRTSRGSAPSPNTASRSMPAPAAPHSVQPPPRQVLKGKKSAMYDREKASPAPPKERSQTVGHGVGPIAIPAGHCGTIDYMGSSMESLDESFKPGRASQASAGSKQYDRMSSVGSQRIHVQVDLENTFSTPSTTTSLHHCDICRGGRGVCRHRGAVGHLCVMNTE